MESLFLSILFSTLNTAVVKSAELRGLERLNVMSVNYVVAALLSLAGWLWNNQDLPQPSTVGLGLMGGFFFAAALFLFMVAIGRAGMALSTTAMRMAVVWPVLLSILAFGEWPTPLQGWGVGLAFLAMGALALPGNRKNRQRSGRPLGWLLALFVVMGGTGITLKLFTGLGHGADRPALLFLIFLFAGVMTWTVTLWRGRPLLPGERIAGAVFGVNNVLSNFFLLRGLEHIPGVLAFPLINCGILLSAALLGVLIWKEKPGSGGYLSMGLSFAAILLIGFGG